jgi:hypothetical protein
MNWAMAISIKHDFGYTVNVTHSLHIQYPAQVCVMQLYVNVSTSVFLSSLMNFLSVSYPL